MNASLRTVLRAGLGLALGFGTSVGLPILLSGNSGCGTCDYPYELGGIPRGTFVVPPEQLVGLFATDAMTVTVTEREVVFRYDEGAGPVEVVYAFDRPNPPVIGASED